MEELGSQIYKEYFDKLKSLVEIEKPVFVEFNIKNYFLKTSIPYFKKLNIIHSKKSIWKVNSDGDNDRIFIYYKNKKIPVDIVFYFISKEKKYKKLGVPIYFSKYLENELRKENKKLVYIETGHINFKNAYFKYKLDLAFEPSGHFYFFKDLKTESPYLALIKFLKIMNDHKNFAHFLNLLKNIKLKRFDIKGNFYENKLKNLVFSFKKRYNLKLKKFDGYLLYNKYIFLHLRKSRTENKLRVSLEWFNTKN